MWKRIGIELGRHVPFTAIGAASGILVMVIVVLAKVPSNISGVIFYTLHPAHVLLSAIVTTAMYKRYRAGKLWAAILIGYTGSVVVATIHDCIVPYLAGESFRLNMEFHLGFIDEWWLVNPAAFLGVAIGYLRPTTKLPHAGHVLVSTWASLFYFTAFGVADWLHLILFMFLFMFFAVWILCCFSDIVYPLLFLKVDPEEIEHEHGH